jgi:hypothetical protein
MPEATSGSPFVAVENLLAVHRLSHESTGQWGAYLPDARSAYRNAAQASGSPFQVNTRSIFAHYVQPYGTRQDAARLGSILTDWRPFGY